jgi:hypothetical protein
MLSGATLTRRIGFAVLAVAIVGSVAACGSKSLTDNFASKITDSNFQASGTLTGSYSTTVSDATVNSTITGTDKIKGKDSAMSMTIAADATTPQAFSTSTDTIDVDGNTYLRDNNGPWTKSADKADATTITGVVNALGLTDKGAQSHFGQQLHRLDATKSVPPSLFFSGTTGITNPVVSLTFWAKDDGTPAGMTMTATYTQASSGSTDDVTMLLEISFDSLSGVSIDPPSM